MYFYHEGYRDAYRADAALDHSASSRDDDSNDEPISIPAILKWLGIVSVALSVIVLAIQALS